MENEPSKDTCVRKIGEPFNMRVCGEPCEYTQRPFGGIWFTGWYHVDRSLDEAHWPVPSRLVK